MATMTFGEYTANTFAAGLNERDVKLWVKPLPMATRLEILRGAGLLKMTTHRDLCAARDAWRASK